MSEPPVVDRPLSELVLERPDWVSVFEQLGLDYCCHGDRSLAQACADAGLELDAVLVELGTSPAPADPEVVPGDPVALADHIVTVHHRYLAEELPALDELAAKVLAAHGERHAELAEVRTLVGELRAELEPHMEKEEMILFPVIRALADGQREFGFGSVENPLRVMNAEHEAAGDVLARLRTTTGGYAVPEDGCASYQLLYERLERVEADTHVHIHKENNLLFPAAIALQATPTA